MHLGHPNVSAAFEMQQRCPEVANDASANDQEVVAGISALGNRLEPVPSLHDARQRLSQGGLFRRCSGPDFLDLAHGDHGVVGEPSIISCDPDVDQTAAMVDLAHEAG